MYDAVRPRVGGPHLLLLLVVVFLRVVAALLRTFGVDADVVFTSTKAVYIYQVQQLRSYHTPVFLLHHLQPHQAIT